MVANKKGFTLLEVMIFTTILTIVLVSAAAFTTRLVYNLRINEHKIFANWNSIFNAAANAPGTTYCVNGNLTVSTTFADTSVFRIPTVGNPCNFNGITGRVPAIFRRELILTRNSTNQVTATVRVSWQEGATVYSDEIQAVYTSW